MCEEVETMRGFCYLGDMVSASGGCNSKSEIWLGEVQGMQRFAEVKKVPTEDERNSLSELC